MSALEPEEEFRPISASELALLVAWTRNSRGWTQETLAELSQLTVRTIQRVENAEPSSVDTRRALARAFEVKDIDAFNKPHTMPSLEKVKREAAEFAEEYLTLPVSIASSGKELLDLADEMKMHMFEQPDGVSGEVAKSVADLFDYLKGYGDVEHDYSYAEKLEIHKHLDEHVQRINKTGFSVCYARRSTKIVGKDWVNKTPWPVVIGYVVVKKQGEEPKHMAVRKALDVGF